MRSRVDRVAFPDLLRLILRPAVSLRASTAGCIPRIVRFRTPCKVSPVFARPRSISESDFDAILGYRRGLDVPQLQAPRFGRPIATHASNTALAPRRSIGDV